MIQVRGQDRSSPPRCLAFCSYHHLSDRSQALKTPVPTSSHILTISQLKPAALHFWFHSEAEPVADSWLQTASHFQPAVSPEDPTGSHSSCGPSRLSLSLGDPGWDQLGAVGTLLWAHARGSDHPTASWSEHSGAEAVTRAIGHSKRSSRYPKHPEGQLQQYRAGCRLLGLLPSPPAIFMMTFEQTKSTQHQHLCNWAYFTLQPHTPMQST